MSEFPSISVVVLNYNGRQHLADCFNSLQKLDYPRQNLELILVDNASTDDSLDLMRQHFPEVCVVRNESNVGFARGNNIGAEAAGGQYVAFLNNDTRVDEAWARELVGPVVRDESVVCTASKMVDWDGKVIDFVHGVMNFYGFGHQKDIGRKNVGVDREMPMLFACGGSMLIDRNVFLETGGFDEDYSFYFEDVDLGWRMWLMGYRVILAPTAITYHRQHATTGQFPDYCRELLYERNALCTIIKNYGQETLDKVLPTALLLTARRAKEYMQIGGVNFEPYHIAGPTPRRNNSETVSRLSLAPLLALNEVADALPALMRKRERVQKRRRRSDAEIFELFGQPFRPASPVTAGNVASQYTLAREFGVSQLFESLQRSVLLVVSGSLPDGDPVSGDDESGPRGLRRALERRGHEVLLASPVPAESNWMIISQEDSESSWDSEPLMHLVYKVFPDIVVACDVEALQDLDGVQIPLVFYPCSDNLAGPTSLGHLADLSVNGTLEESVDLLDRFCRLPILKTRPSASKQRAMRQRGTVHQGQGVHEKSFGELLGEVWSHFQRGGIPGLLKATHGFVRRVLWR